MEKLVQNSKTFLTLKFLDLNAKEGNKGNVLLNKDGAIQCEHCKKAKYCKKLFSKLATSLVKKLPIAPSRFNSFTIYFTIKEPSFSYSKNLYCININKAARMDQISAKLPK